MTAIYGVWCWGGDEVPLKHCDIMARALSRFGRAGSEEWSDRSLRLGRRIFPAVPEDRFPYAISAPDWRYAVVSDVRLTERTELIGLLGLGDEALAMSDATLVSAALERWNEDAFEHIYGAFAVAAWDTKDNRLLLARDVRGDKPLFFYCGQNYFAFASMPVGLQMLPDVPRKPDYLQVERALRLLPATFGKSFFAEIGCVMPGHYVVVSGDSFTTERYWRPDLTPLMLPRQEDYEVQFSQRFENAVAASLRGAGDQVGAHLSAGFDSTAVATTAAKLMLARDAKVIAFTGVPSAGFKKESTVGRIINEGELASLTAAMHSNMDHVEVTSASLSYNDVDRAASIYPLPVLNLSNLSWVEAINDAARMRGLSVVLEGGMGNATISETGFDALHYLFRKGRWLEWLRIGAGLRKNRLMGWRGVLRCTFERWLPDRILQKAGRLPPEQQQLSALRREVWDRVTHEAEQANSELDRFDRTPLGGSGRENGDSLDWRIAMLHNDRGSYFKAVLGEWGIDQRDPTSDRRLTEFSLRVPVERHIEKGQPRALLRNFLQDRVPQEILNERRSGAQAADWYERLSSVESFIKDEIESIAMHEPSAEILDIERLQRLMKDWPEPGSKEWQSLEAEINYRCAVLRGVSASKFMRKAAGGNS